MQPLLLLLSWLSDNNARKISQGIDPLFYPDEQGLRTGLMKAYQAWQQDISALLITQVHSEELPSIVIKSLSLGDGYLSQAVVQQLIDNSFIKGEKNKILNEGEEILIKFQ